jgi:hypothetical protein
MQCAGGAFSSEYMAPAALQQGARRHDGRIFIRGSGGYSHGVQQISDKLARLVR